MEKQIIRGIGEPLDRRDFLKIAGIVAGSMVLSPRLGPHHMEEGAKPKEELTPWDKVKRQEIENVFGFDKETGKFTELIPFSEFSRLDIKWPPENLPTEDLERVNRELRSNYGFELKCGWKTLLQYTTRRYQEIVRNPYLTIIDPTAEEVKLLVETFSDLTGLPEEFIYVLGFRENGLRGNHPSIHGEKYYAASGDGMMSPNVHDGAWGRKIKQGKFEEKEIGFLKVYGQKDFSIPVPSRVIVVDSAMNLAFGLSIYIEHLSQLMTHSDLKTFKDYTLCKSLYLEKFQLKDSQDKNQAALMGVCYMLYWHGLEPAVVRLNDEIQRGIINLPEEFEEDSYFSSPIEKAIGTFSNRPWENSDYLIEGQTAESKNLTFYCPLKKDLRGLFLQITEKIESYSHFSTKPEERADFLYFLFTHPREQRYVLELIREQADEYLSAEEKDVLIKGYKEVLSDISENAFSPGRLNQWKQTLLFCDEIANLLQEKSDRSFEKGEKFSDSEGRLFELFRYISLGFTLDLIMPFYSTRGILSCDLLKKGRYENYLENIKWYQQYKEELWQYFHSFVKKETVDFI